jgi:hypothetical protein
MTIRYLPHIIYSIALTSISMHLLNTRKNAADERAAFRARESVLTSLITRLKTGENVSDAEIAKMRLMGNSKGGMVAMYELPNPGGGKSTSWKDAVMGQKSNEHDDLKQLEDCASICSFLFWIVDVFVRFELTE